ncbi:hypothetical protein B0J15DRAFT_406161, partial [Fusarium solani]
KGPVKCEFTGCSKIFPRPTELHKHYRTHAPPVPCKAGCGELFQWNNAMFRHVRLAHRSFADDLNNGIPPDGGECPYSDCDETFTRDENRKRHIDKQHL